MRQICPRRGGPCDVHCGLIALDAGDVHGALGCEQACGGADAGGHVDDVLPGTQVEDVGKAFDERLLTG